MNQDVIIGIAVVQIATYGFVYGQAVRPYGPKMCENSCTHLSRCSSFGFNPSTLSCQIATNRSDESNFVKLSFNESKKKPMNCSKAGRIISTKSKKRICVSEGERNKRACPEDFHHDVDAATCLLMVKADKTFQFQDAAEECAKRGDGIHLAVFNSTKDIKSAKAYINKVSDELSYNEADIWVANREEHSCKSSKKFLQYCAWLSPKLDYCLYYYPCDFNLHGYLCQVDVNY